MKIQYQKSQKILIFWPKNAAEEKVLDGPMREAFEEKEIMTDRCWSMGQILSKSRLGIRIFLP